MNSYGFLYAVGCIFLLLGERMLGDSQLLRYILSTSGILALVGSLITSNSMLKNASPNQKIALAYPRTLILCTFGSLFIYASTTDTVLDVLNLEDESTFVVICQVISSILYVCSAIPLMAITYLHNQGPYHISNRNARPVLLQWLGFSFLLLSLIHI